MKSTRDNLRFRLFYWFRSYQHTCYIRNSTNIRKKQSSKNKWGFSSRRVCYLYAGTLWSAPCLFNYLPLVYYLFSHLLFLCDDVSWCFLFSPFCLVIGVSMSQSSEKLLFPPGFCCILTPLNVFLPFCAI